MASAPMVQALSRYPVKSMRGEPLTEATLALHGIPGDRLYAFVPDGDVSVFPWLTAKRLAALVTYQPIWEDREGQPPALLIATPGGAQQPVASAELAAEIGERFGRPVHLHADYRGNQDVAYLSIITTATVRVLCEAAGVPVDARRFRMNIVVETGDEPFQERGWAGRSFSLGEAHIAVTEPDKRCQFLNLDPETGESTPSVLKAAGQLNDVCAGVYASVLRAGRVALGDSLEAAS